MPTALVTGSPERVPEIVIALKSAGFDILAAGAMSAEDRPDLEDASVDCYVALGATVVLVTEGPEPGDHSAGPPDPDQTAWRTLVGVLAEAILRECGRSGVRATVVGEDRAPEEIAALAGHRPPEPVPWWLFAGVEPDLDYADWRNSVLCLASLRG